MTCVNWYGAVATSFGLHHVVVEVALGCLGEEGELLEVEVLGLDKEKGEGVGRRLAIAWIWHQEIR